MADPFSIVAGTVGVADVCFRLGVEIRRLIQDTGSVGKELDALLQGVSELEAICKTIRNTFEAKSKDGLPEYSKFEQPLELRKHLDQALSNCHGVLNKVDEMIRAIRGSTTESPLGKVDSIKAAIRKRMRESDVHNWRVQLATYQSALQLVLTAITFQEAKTSHGSTSRSIDDLSGDVRNLDESLQLQLDDLKTSALLSGGSNYDMAALVALKDLREAVNTAASTVQSMFTNRHFDIPQSVSSIFTGREDQLEELARIFVPERRIVRDQFQRRFIIHGLGGSGKTQFCCKFAEVNRDSFWGIFWIDASTPERIKQTLNDICEIAGIEKNENAAMHWLSNLEHRWLLIIDNADDLEVPLEKYFPKGNRGNVLVTTRDPAYKVHGNVGPGFHEFRGLELSEATLLLRKASGEPNWDAACEAVASSITKALGFLALAIIHAGAAIRDRLCRLGDYLDYYGRSWRRLRKSETAKRVESTDLETAVYATWEICYGRLEQRRTEAALDAIDLLSTLAFFHWDNIGPQIFTRALNNPQLEAEQESKAAEEPQPLNSQPSNTWASYLRKIPVVALRYVFGTTSPQALPRFLRDSMQSGFAADGEDRLRLALKELTRMSLVIHNEYSDTYWIHPIVHKWARERMRPADQALWADMSATVLSASILMPPLGTTTEDENYHLGLLSHVRHVQASRSSATTRLIKARVSQRPSSVWISRLIPALGVNTDELRMCGKFAVVYYKCGEWQSAAELLVRVRDALCLYLGPDHKRARTVTLYLSAIYWNMGWPEEAARLQSNLLGVCVRSLGPGHPETLKVMSELGKTRWQQGQYTAAAQLQEEVLEKLKARLPQDDEDVLEAMDNLGLTVHKFWERADFERAYGLHSAAVDGLSKIHGADHPRTLIAKENVCRVSALLGGPRLASGRELMTEVFETRRQSLGREHPYTLLAMVNMAILLSATGEPDKAEVLILEGLPVADRNIGRGHVGTLFGRHTLACIWAQQGRFSEAEELLTEVAEGQRTMRSLRGDYHPDRLGALIELSRCCFEQGKIGRAISICDEAIDGFDFISHKPHPLAVGLRKARAGMIEMQDGGEERDIVFPFILFRISDD